MGVETKEIRFVGQLVAGQECGRHSRPWDRLLEQFEIAVDGIPPATADLTFQLRIKDDLQPQVFTLPAGQTLVEIAVDSSAGILPANAIIAARCITADGHASDVVITLIAATRMFGDALFGDAEVSGEDVMTLTAYLTAADITAAFSGPEELIELLDNPRNPTGALNTALRDAIIARVQGEFDGAFKRRYLTPLVVPTADAASILMTLGGHALALWKFYAMENRPHLLEAYPGVNTSFKRATQWLADVRDGKEVFSAKTLAGAPARTGNVQTGHHTGTFNRDRLRGW